MTEPADVLIIGAGASGGVVGLRLAEAGFSVVCLEQGGWLDRADYPGNKLDWELQARKRWATSPKDWLTTFASRRIRTMMAMTSDPKYRRCMRAALALRS